MATDYRFGIRLAVEGEGDVVASTERAGKGFADMGDRANSVGRITDELFGKLKGLAVAYVGVHTVREFLQTADAMNAMDGRLRNVLGSTDEFNAAQKELYRVAQANNVALSDSSSLFARIHDPIVKMGGGVRESVLQVEALTTGLRINNATQAESSSAILQYSQAVASGVLRGEEFNAVNEAAPQFMHALADALGVGRGELREMAKDGKLTADVIGNAMPRALAELQGRAAGLPETAGAALSDLRNDAGLLAQQFDKTTGSTSGLVDLINAASGFVRFLTNALNDNASSAKVAGGGFDTVGFAIKVVGTIAETVLVVMADVSFVLKSIGREAGGLAAQVVAAAKLEFGEAKRIGDEMKADAVAARAELDRYKASVIGMTDKVLAQRDALKQHSVSASENAAEMLRLQRQNTLTGGGYATLTSATNNSANAGREAARMAREVAAEQARQSDVIAKLSGLTTTFSEDWNRLSAMYRSGKLSVEQLTDAQAALLAKQPFAVEQAKELADAMKAADRATIDAGKSADSYRESIVKKNSSLADEIAKQSAANEELRTGSKVKVENTAETYLAAAASADRAALIALERREDMALYDALKQQAAQYRELAGLKRDGIYAAEVAKVRTEWEKTTEQIEKGLTDSLFRAFESGKSFWSTLWDGIVNTFKVTILKPIIQNTVADFLGWFKVGAKTIDSTVLNPTFSTGGIAAWLEAFMGGLKSLLSWFSEAFSGVMSWLGSGIGSIIDSVASLFGVTNASGTVGSWLGLGSGASGGGLLGTASQASSLSSLLNGGGIVGSVLGSSAAYGAALGTTSIGAGSQAGMLAAQTGEFGLAGLKATSSAASTAGTGAAAGMSGTAMAGLGAFGLFALGVLDVLNNDSTPTDHYGGAYLANGSGVRTLATAYNGELPGNSAQLTGQVAADINALLAGLGSSQRLDYLQAAGVTGPGVYAGGRLTGGAMFGEVTANRNDPFVAPGGDPIYETVYDESGSSRVVVGQNPWEIYDRASQFDIDPNSVARNFQLELAQSAIQALQAAGDLPQQVNDYLRGYDAEAMTLPQIGQVLAQVALMQPEGRKSPAAEEQAQKTQEGMLKQLEALNAQIAQLAKPIKTTADVLDRASYGTDGGLRMVEGST